MNARSMSHLSFVDPGRYQLDSGPSRNRAPLAYQPSSSKRPTDGYPPNRSPSTPLSTPRTPAPPSPLHKVKSTRPPLNKRARDETLPDIQAYFQSRPSSISQRPPGLVPQARPSLRKSKSIGSPLNKVAREPDSPEGSKDAEKRSKTEPSFSLPTFQWVKGNLIGKGSQGRVYFALNATTGDFMAVKQVERPQTKSDYMKADLKEIVQSLREERDTLKDLEHPNIVQYLGFEENQETLNIFLEYVSGGTISTCLQTYGRFREDVTKHFTRQILEGLEYLHSRGILHRDMKADNILVEESGICKISDFGISKRLEDRSRAFSFKGTAFWMAPETLSHFGKGYDIKIDIWSVGCVVHEMWTALRPWAEVDFLSAMCKLLDSEDKLPPLPEGILLSNLADHFRKECFQVNPIERPPAAALLHHPYLTLPKSWKFPGTFAMACAAIPEPPNPRLEVENGSLSTSGFSHLKTMLGDIHPVRSGNVSREHSPALTMNSQLTHSSVRPLPALPPSSSTPLPPLPRAITPPLVYIVPLSPRRKQSAHAPNSVGRQRSPSVTSESSSSQTSSQASSSDIPSRKARKLVLHEVLDTSDETKGRLPSKPLAYNYVPPPLPEIKATLPYSTHLLPQSKSLQLSARYPSHHLHQSTSTTSLPNQTKPPLASIEQQHDGFPRRHSNILSDYDTFNTTSTDSALGSIWQRPPARANLSALPQHNSNSLPTQQQSADSHTSLGLASSRRMSASSNSDTESFLSGGSTWQKPPVAVAKHQATSRMVRDPAGTPLVSDASDNNDNDPRWSNMGKREPSLVPHTRPGVKEVFENLEEFFPQHNLHAPIIEDPDALELEASSTLQDKTERARAKRVTMKSIRSIAEEHIQRNSLDSPQSRRSTRLWDSRLEEIKVRR